MSKMGGMPKPGGWTMSTPSMRMPGFVAMLWRYRQTVEATAKSRLWWLTILVGVGYFFLWSLCGAILFPLGAALASVEMRSSALARMVPIAEAVIVLIAGGVQFTRWKAYHLACCREASVRGDGLTAGARAAWMHGTRLAFHCISSCVGLTLILLVIGIIDFRATALVTVAITVERLSPGGVRIARAIGVGVVTMGLFLIAQPQSGFHNDLCHTFPPMHGASTPCS